VVRKRRTSGRGGAAGVFRSVTNVRSVFAWVTGSLSAIKTEDTAQSSQEGQYFSGVCVSLSPDLASAGVWQGGAEASAICTESADMSTCPVTQHAMTGVAIIMKAANKQMTVEMTLMLAS
jgi:hypothetical protein